MREVLTFDVVGFPGTYHAILGRPCYAKFMAIPNYTYLKLKMLGRNDVIIVSTASEHAYECDIECIEQVEAIVKTVSLITRLGDVDQDIPDPKRHTRSFEPEASKGKALRISSSLDPK